jgi:hypothetical protein
MADSTPPQKQNQELVEEIVDEYYLDPNSLGPEDIEIIQTSYAELRKPSDMEFVIPQNQIPGEGETISMSQMFDFSAKALEANTTTMAELLMAELPQALPKELIAELINDNGGADISMQAPPLPSDFLELSPTEKVAVYTTRADKMESNIDISQVALSIEQWGIREQHGRELEEDKKLTRCWSPRRANGTRMQLKNWVLSFVVTCKQQQIRQSLGTIERL